MEQTIYRLEFRFEQDVVQARQRARDIARLLGFESQDQIRLATAASEIGRNAFLYARQGAIEFAVKIQPPQGLIIKVSDAGPGIRDLQEILSGRYQSRTGLGMGIIGTHRLMDHFNIETGPGGTHVRMEKRLPRNATYLTSANLRKITSELDRREPENPFEEVQRQNQELLKTLSELRARQDELDALNRELEDTNRGVVALYAELEERADYLKRASELKTSFLSNMSHEFRTPLNSIISLARMLLDRMDGELSPEQEKQVRFIQRSAQELYELVNDLLDLAKVEAGKTQMRIGEFDVSDVFGALRGMLKPLLAENTLELAFDESAGLPKLNTDQGKLSQILRNFISNAIKFTRRGEVRVGARASEGNKVVFTVSDTGIGIAPADQERIFEEFTQVENSIQTRVKGTGLGLPLCRKLAGLLGGRVWVESEVGIGSVFSVEIPAIYPERTSEPVLNLEDVREIRPIPGSVQELPVLIIEDNPETAYIMSSMLERTEFQPQVASTLEQARAMLGHLRPVAVTLDPVLHGEDCLGFVSELRGNPEYGNFPIIIISTGEVEPERSRGVNAVLRKPVEPDGLRRLLQELTHRTPRKRVLIVNDNEVSRYVLRQQLESPFLEVIEARGGREALDFVTRETPDAIFLDLAMPDLSGHEVLRRLRTAEKTRGIPVVIHTSKNLSAEERESLLQMAEAILPKRLTSDRSGLEELGKITVLLGLVPQPQPETQHA